MGKHVGWSKLELTWKVCAAHWLSCRQVLRIDGSESANRQQSATGGKKIVVKLSDPAVSVRPAFHTAREPFLNCDFEAGRSAGDGDRTRTALSGHRILSPVRMPVSPLLHDRLTGSSCDQLSL